MLRIFSLYSRHHVVAFVRPELMMELHVLVRFDGVQAWWSGSRDGTIIVFVGSA